MFCRFVSGGPVLPVKAKPLHANHPTASVKTSKLKTMTDLYPSVSSIPDIVKVSIFLFSRLAVLSDVPLVAFFFIVLHF